MSLQRMIELENQIDDINEMMEECDPEETLYCELGEALDEAMSELNQLQEIAK